MKLLIQLADNLVEKGHAHVTELKRWVSTVDRRYRDFSLRMAKYQESLERSLGVSSEVNAHASNICVDVWMTKHSSQRWRCLALAGHQRPGVGHYSRQPDGRPGGETSGSQP